MDDHLLVDCPERQTRNQSTNRCLVYGFLYDQGAQVVLLTIRCRMVYDQRYTNSITENHLSFFLWDHVSWAQCVCVCVQGFRFALNQVNHHTGTVRLCQHHLWLGYQWSITG